MNSPLIFLTNRLLNPSYHKQMHLPLEFIAFGITEGRMYKHFRNTGYFVVPIDTLHRWGNSVVYGGLFLCPDIDFYLRVFDAYFLCSLSTLGKNHIKDKHHRIITKVTPIYFNTLEELSRLQYREGETPISAFMYIGNIHNPELSHRIHSINPSYRVIDGVEVKHFKNLFKEVNE